MKTARIPPAVRELLLFPYSPRFVPLIILVFSAVVLGANRIHNSLCHVTTELECVRYWPISMFFPRVPPDIGFPNLLHILVAVAALGLFVTSLHILPRAGYRPLVVAALAWTLILATSLTHGWQLGLARPTGGAPNVGPDYYQEASTISSPQAFVRGFNAAQPALSVHARAHPPGAMLAIYYLQHLVGDPAIGSIVIAAIAVALTAIFLNKLLATQYDRRVVGLSLFLFFLIPSVQVYFAASLDALLAPLIIGACLTFFSKSPLSFVVSAACLLLASFLHFSFVFILPVLLAFEIWKHRGPWRTVALVLMVILAYALLYVFLDFNYLQAFLSASRSVNPLGFRLFAQPADYFMTRLEDVAEVALFFGPFLSILLVAGLAIFKPRKPLATLSLLAIASLSFVFLAGAYETGETARGTLFIYPFLLLPVAERISQPDMDHRDYTRLAWLVFLQALLMQLVGNYWW